MTRIPINGPLFLAEMDQFMDTATRADNFIRFLQNLSDSDWDRLVEDPESRKCLEKFIEAFKRVEREMNEQKAEDLRCGILPPEESEQ
jgi:hypothetical protein